MNDQTAAGMAVVILGALIVFQLLLASGRPLGEYAWGGGSRVLPPRLRAASVVATLVYAAAAVFVLEAAGVTDLIPTDQLPRTATWVFAALFALGVPLNAVSRSRKERVMALVSLALAVLFLVVAQGG